jgi:hypothetical protein
LPSPAWSPIALAATPWQGGPCVVPAQMQRQGRRAHYGLLWPKPYQGKNRSSPVSLNPDHSVGRRRPPVRSAGRALEPPPSHPSAERQRPEQPAPPSRRAAPPLFAVRSARGPKPLRGYGPRPAVCPSDERPTARAAEQASSSAPPAFARCPLGLGPSRSAPPRLRRSAHRPPSA